MKLDKRFVCVAALVLGLGVGIAACSDDDKDKDNDTLTCSADDHKVLNAAGDACECMTGYHVSQTNADVCEENPKCTLNGDLDAGEACDGTHFADDHKTCADWARDNPSEPQGEYEGEPGCGNSCTLTKGTCRLKDDPCGDGNIDATIGEICDVGANKSDPSDDALAPGVTCNDYQAGDWAEGGKPSCASNCKAYGKGTCEPAGTVHDVNGVVACGSNLSITDKTASATVTYEVKNASDTVKAGIVCNGPAAEVEAAVANATLSDVSNGSGALTADLSTMAAGSYVCYVVVKAGDKGSVICPLASGAPARAAGNITTFENSTVPFVVDAAGELAIWNNFSADNMKQTLLSTDGMNANAGSQKDAASLKFVLMSGVNPDEKDLIKKTQSSVGGSTINALLIGGKAWVSEATDALSTSTNSYLVISGLTNATEISITASEGKNGGHMVVVADDDTAHPLIDHSKDKAQENPWPADYTATETIPSGTTALYIYAYGIGNDANLIIDNITIK